MRTPRLHPARPLPALLLLLTLLTPALAWAGQWTSGGYPVFDSSRDEEVGYLPGLPSGTVVCSDTTGGLIAACVFRVDSIRVQRIDQATGARLWNGTAGIYVNPGGNLNTNGQVKVKSDLHGGAWVAWSDTRAGTPGVYVQRVDPSGAIQLTAGGKRFGSFAADFDIDVASTGALLLAFGEASGVRVQRVSLTGAEEWTAGGVLIASGDIPSYVDVTNLGDGAVVSWNAARVISAVSRTGVFCNRVTTAGAVLWGANGVTVYHDAVTSANTSSHAYSTTSQLVITWLVGDEIRAQKYAITGVAAWAAGGVSVFTRLNTAWDDPTLPFNVRIVPSGTGAILGWVDGRDSNRPGPNGFNHAQDLYAQRLSNTGALLWGANGAPIDTATGTQRSLRMVSDGADGFYATYVDLFFTTALGEDDIAAARMDLNGARTWKQSVTTSFAGAGVQDEPTLASDPATGILLAWTDRRDDATNGRDLYAHHFAADGSRFNPTFTLTSPNGGESLQGFAPVTVTWTSSQLPATANVRIAYNVAGGLRQTLLASTPNDGSVVVNLPGGINSSQVRFHVADALDGTPADSSNAFVTVCGSLAGGSVQAHGSGVPRRIVTGDLNGDGILDLVTAASTGVARLLGLGGGGVGNGTFGATVSLSAATTIDIALADADEDGILDLFTIEGPTQPVLYRHGHGVAGVGDGTFDAPVTVTTTVSSRLAVGDLDGDGMLDVVSADYSSPGGHIAYGLGSDGVGNGTFAAPVTVALPEQAQALVIADMNRDGANDLIELQSSLLLATDSLVVLRGGRALGASGGGDRTFTKTVSTALTEGWKDLVVADVNNDGNLDALIAKRDSTFWFRGNASATFTGNPTRSAGGGDRLAVSDIDGDGRVDLIGSSEIANSLTYLFGNGTGATGNGSFTAVTGAALTGNVGFGVAVDDFDENGAPDVVVGSLAVTTARVETRLGACPPALPTDLTVTGPAAGTLFQLRDGNTATVTWTKGGAIAAVDVAISRDSGVHWETVARDVYATSFAWPVTGPLGTHLRARVTDSFAAQRFAASGGDFALCAAIAMTDSSAGPATVFGAVSADFDEDGRYDLALATDSGVSVMLRTATGGLGAPVTYGAGTPCRALTTGDFDEDGITDLAAGTTSGLATFRGLGAGATGNGTFAAPVAVTLSDSITALAAGDVNGDGITDLVCAAPLAASARLVLGQGANNTGNGAFVPATPGGFIGLSKAPRELVLADFNEDGALDIAAANDDSLFSTVTVVLGQLSGVVPNGTFGTAAHYPAGVKPNHIVARDFDNDGVLDLFVTNDSHPGTITLLEGNGAAGVGDGTFAAPVTIPGVTDPRALVVQDYSQDGNEDLAVLSGSGRTVTLSLRTLSNLFASAYAPEPALPFAGTATSALTGAPGGLDGLPDLMLAGTGPDRVRVLGDACPTSVLETVSLTTPAGGEVWEAATRQTIAWNPGFALRRVHLEVSRDGGTVWERIASDAPAGNVFLPGSFSMPWVVMAPATTHARIRIVDAMVPTIADTSAEFTIGGSLLDADALGPPREASLSAAWPNPSAGAVSLVLALPAPQRVSVSVFDMQGRHIRTLVDGALAAGRHPLAWDGRLEGGTRAASGLYFVRARAAGFEATRRVIRMR